MSESTSLIEFPCDFTVKVMGVRHPEFAALILACVRRYVPAASEEHIRLRASSKGNYLGATVVLPDVQNQAQLDEVYRALTGHELVKVVL